MAKRLVTLLRAALGVGLLGYVLSANAGWTTEKHLLSTAWLLPALAMLSLVAAAIESLQLGLLFRSQGMWLSFSGGFRLSVVGTFFNFCIPGGTGGDVVKLYYLASQNRGRGVEIATVLLVSRATALFSMLSIVVALALLEGQLVMDHALIQWLVLAAAVGAFGLLVVGGVSCSRHIGAGRVTRWATANIPLSRHVQRVFNALSAFQDHKRALLGAVVLSLTGHLVMAGMFLMIAAVLIPAAPGVVTCMLAFLGMLANALPITPGGLGVGEAAFDRLFRIAGYVGGAPLILTWRFGLLPLCLLGGLLYITGVHRGRRFMDRASDFADVSLG